ncbi:MAG: hypothetical protein QOF02_2832 [Blastocatellia bacterium]|jgi:hypothetical protein|nr:hypothetical protein [Blastocatellia bacterium]
MLVKTIKLSLLALSLLFGGGLTLVSAQTRQSSPAGQKVTEEELDRRFAIARSLAQEEKFEQALKEYLFVFDNSRNVGGYGGVRLSYVPSEIAAIGRVYRPALLALQTRRDEREKSVLAGKADFDVIHELAALNEYLGEPERTITLFDKLKTMGAAYTSVREDMLILIWEQLAEAKRYDELKDKIDELAKRVASQIAESVINNDFPDNSVLSSSQYQDYLRRSIIEDGGRVYETLLGVGKAAKADKLAKWMLTFSSDGEMYAQLINRAINVNRTDIAADLIERATKTLKRGEDLRLVHEAAKRLPKAN